MHVVHFHQVCHMLSFLFTAGSIFMVVIRGVIRVMWGGQTQMVMVDVPHVTKNTWKDSGDLERPIDNGDFNWYSTEILERSVKNAHCRGDSLNYLPSIPLIISTIPPLDSRLH